MGKSKVLVIEDNSQNMYLVTYLLTAAGYEVVPARNGRDGIDLARQERPSLILLDIQLPEMDGYAVARQLTALPEINGVPIVAVTSYAMPGDKEKALAAGCIGYLEKPIDPDKFMDDVNRFLV